jgi:cell division protein FtsI/penicillin-binding protein 2
MLARTDSRGRLVLLLAVLVLLSGGMAARLAYWQISQHDQLAALSAQDSSLQRIVPAKRGTIYDRTGTVVLAQTIERYRIVADLHGMTLERRNRDAAALVDYLGLDPEDELELRQAMVSDGYYVILATNVDAQIASDIMTAQKNGALTELTLEPTPARIYPQAGGAPHTSLAAHLLGFVNAAGSSTTSCWPASPPC